MFPWTIGTRMTMGTTIHPGVTHTEARAVAEEAVSQLESRVELLELTCAGLWELLKSRTGMTDDELVASIQAVDAKDGAIDGKISSGGNQVCPHCNRKLLTRRVPKCSWCGADIVRNPVVAH